MFKKRYLTVIILFSFILISSISAISAEDSNATDIQTLEDEDIELEQSDSNQDVLSSEKLFSDLNDLINNSADTQISLEDDYTYMSYDDNSLTVNRDNIVIDGKGHTITGAVNSKNPAYGFYVTSKNVVIKNINFMIMGSSNLDRNGGAISSSDLLNNLTVINCTFKYCCGHWGGAISEANLVENCTFDYCYADMGGGVYNSALVKNSNFSNCHAGEGGAISGCDAVNCNFNNNQAGMGGAGRMGTFINCTFNGNSADNGGAVLQAFSNDVIFNSTFINNRASGTGGALYSNFGNYYVFNSTFENNTASANAVSKRADLVLCSFKNNTANNGLQYESGTIGLVTLYSPVISYYFTCPDQVEIPIYYAYKWGTGSDEYFKYKNKVYLFNGINTTLKLCKDYSYDAIYEVSALSGSSFIADLDKGKYTLRANYASGSSSMSYYITVYGEKTNISAENYTEMYVAEDKYLVVNLTENENNPLFGFNVSLKENDKVLDILTTDDKGQVSFSLKNLTFGRHDFYLEFLEDARHEASSLPVTVVVNKFGTLINANDISAFASEDIRLLVNLTDYENNPMVGYAVYLKENGVVLDNLTTDSNGQVTFSLNDLSFGSHSLSVEFLEDNNFSSSSAQVDVVINRFATVIKADDVDAFVSDDLSLLVNLTDDENNPLEGYVVYLKEDGNVLDNFTTDSNGQVRFSLSDISAGSHSLYVEFLGNRIYENSSAPVTVAIDKYYSIIKAENVTGYTYQGINLLVSLTDGDNSPMADCVVYLKENGVVLYNLTTDSNGQVSFSLNDLSEGSHVLYVEFMESRFYRGSALPVSAIINKWDTVIRADNITAFAVEDINLLVSLTDGDNSPMAGCVVYLKENGVVLYNLTTDSNGRVSFSLNDLSAGSHVIYVEFLENRLYKGSALPVSVVINRFSSSINASNVVAYVVDDITLLVNLSYGENNPIGNCEIYLKENDEILDVLTTDEMGHVIFSLNDLSVGSHSLSVEFLGNRFYDGSVLPVSVSINKVETSLKADNVVAFPNEGKIIVKLTDQWGNPLNDAQVYLNLAYFKNKIIAPIGNGEYEFNLGGLAARKSTGKITFNGNDTHNGSIIDISVEILDRLNSTIYADNHTLTYGDFNNFTAYLKDSNGNPIDNVDVKLIIDSRYVSVKTNGEGEAKFDLSVFNLPIGSYNGKITLDLTNRYMPSSTNVNITVIKIPTVIIAPDVTCTYGDGKYMVVTLKDKYDNPIKRQGIAVKINNQTITQGTDDNGQAKLLINLVSGKYAVEVSFAGTAYYESSSATLNITVNPKSEIPIDDNSSGGEVDPVITPVDNTTSGGEVVPVDNTTSGSGADQKPFETTSNNPTPAENQGDYLVITLKDDSGNLLVNKDVIIELNGHSYSYRTNGKGQVKILGESLVPKTYKAKVTVLDDNKNKVSSFNMNIVVKKAKPKLIAKNKKFKAKKKVKKYTIYLKVGKKPIKKVKVTLKIKGKIYKAKTNKKGRAIFKLKKLTKKGKYKAVITFKGNKWYSKATKKVKIVIK